MASTRVVLPPPTGPALVRIGHLLVVIGDDDVVTFRFGVTVDERVLLILPLKIVDMANLVAAEDMAQYMNRRV
jgi:hypothetical protein